MLISIGSVFALACAAVLVNAGIVINQNGCPVSANYEALLPHEKCEKFYHCVNGRLVVRECPDGLLFNYKTKVCDWPQNVVCERKDVAVHSSHHSEAPVICAARESDGVLVPHEKCNHFYKCAHGLPVSLPCPPNLLYNPSLEMCDWKENVQCNDRIIPDNNDENADNGSGHGNDDDKNEGDEEQNDNTNCDPSEAPTICAKTGNDGVLVAHEACNQFYKCTFGHPVALYCPSGLLYNSKKEQCDWPSDVICGDRIIPEDKEADVPGDDNGGNNNSDPSEAETICAKTGSDGDLVAHENCNQFYKCSRGLPVAKYCPSTLLYNPKLQVCDWPHDVDCGNRLIPDEKDVEVDDKEDDQQEIRDDPSKAPEICAEEGSDHVLIAHEKCDHFYQCHGGKAWELKCQNNLLYNPKNTWCDFPKNVDCGNRIVPLEKYSRQKTDQSFQGYKYANIASDICAKEVTGDVLVAHEKCNFFYGCANGIPVAIKCPPTLLYNPKKDICDWPENVYCGDRIIPDENDDDGHDQEKEEEKEHEINSDPSKAPYICAKEESDGKLIAHEKCNYFYKCVNGQPKALKCGEMLFYNPTNGRCDWPKNVECDRRVIV